MLRCWLIMLRVMLILELLVLFLVIMWVSLECSFFSLWMLVLFVL